VAGNSLSNAIRKAFVLAQSRLGRWTQPNSRGARAYKLPSGTTSEYGRYVKSLWGAPRRAERPSMGLLLNPDEEPRGGDCWWARAFHLGVHCKYSVAFCSQVVGRSEHSMPRARDPARWLILASQRRVEKTGSAAHPAFVLDELNQSGRA